MITLRTLHKATAQEVFDQVAKHLLKQGVKSTDKGNGLCVYKSDDGYKCAAGCLIAKSEYRKKYEGAGWKGLIQKYGVTSSHSDLIRDLQKMHDNADPITWPNHLKSLADIHGLNIEVLKKPKTKQNEF